MVDLNLDNTEILTQYHQGLALLMRTVTINSWLKSLIYQDAIQTTKLIQFVIIHLTRFKLPFPEADMSLEQQKVNLEKI